MSELSRRAFVGGVIAGGGLLSLAIATGCGGGRQQQMIAHAEKTGELAPNIFVTVKPDGRIALAVNKAELGQGVATGYATLVAEELEVDLDAVDVHYADSLPAYRTSFRLHQTGGSRSMMEAYVPLRRAAAAAREMLVAAAAARWQVKASACAAAAGRVTHTASGRSLGYGELTRDAAHLAIPDAPRLKAPGEFRLIGKPGRRVDGRAKVDGTAGFGIDVVVPGMVHAVAIHGPVFGAAPAAVDAGLARTRRGVIDVLRFDWGVAVVAEKYWQALAAARDVIVTWGEGAAAGLDTEVMRVAMRAWKKQGTVAKNRGDLDDALGDAAGRLDAVYEAPFLAHAPMEPQNCTVHVRGGAAEVWAPCQSPTVVQEFVAEAAGLDKNDVLVHTTLSGGGFGRRIVPDVAAQAATISKRVGKPVKLIWSRDSDMTQGFYRPQFTALARGAFGADGRPTALGFHTLSQSIVLDSGDLAYAAMPGIPRALQRVIVESMLAMFSSGSLPDLFSTEGLRDTPYRVPHLRVEYTPVDSGVPVASWRSVGHSFTAFAVESFLDELAAAAGRDPVEVRRELLPEGSRARRVLDAVAKLSGWGTPLRPGLGRGLARHTSFDSEVAEVAEVEVIDGRIRVRKVYVAVDCGVAVNPDVVRAQCEGAVIFGLSAALDQEITLVDGVVQQRNYDGFPALRMHECPEIVVEILASDEPATGIGEPGLPPIAPAVANALFAATGVRLRRLPLQPSWDREHAR